MVATKAAPILSQVLFRQYNPSFSSTIPTYNSGGTAQPDGAGTSPVAQAPTKTATPESATSMAIGGGKLNSNRTRLTDGLGTESELSVDRDSDVTLAASAGVSNTDTYYSGSSYNLPAILYNFPELVEHLNELKKMHEYVRAELGRFSLSRDLFTQTYEINPTYLVNKEINTYKKHQDNGAMPQLLTQPSSPHSTPLDDPESP